MIRINLLGRERPNSPMRLPRPGKSRISRALEKAEAERLANLQRWAEPYRQAGQLSGIPEGDAYLLDDPEFYHDVLSNLSMTERSAVESDSPGNTGNYAVDQLKAALQRQKKKEAAHNGFREAARNLFTPRRIVVASVTTGMALLAMVGWRSCSFLSDSETVMVAFPAVSYSAAEDNLAVPTPDPNPRTLISLLYERGHNWLFDTDGLMAKRTAYIRALTSVRDDLGEGYVCEGAKLWKASTILYPPGLNINEVPRYVATEPQGTPVRVIGAVGNQPPYGKEVMVQVDPVLFHDPMYPFYFVATDEVRTACPSHSPDSIPWYEGDQKPTQTAGRKIYDNLVNDQDFGEAGRAYVCSHHTPVYDFLITPNSLKTWTNREPARVLKADTEVLIVGKFEVEDFQLAKGDNPTADQYRIYVVGDRKSSYFVEKGKLEPEPCSPSSVRIRPRAAPRR